MRWRNANRAGVVRLAIGVLLMLLGLTLAAPPAARWGKRTCLDWQGEREWKQALSRARSPRPGDPVARLTIREISLAQNVLLGASKDNLARWPSFVTTASPRLILGHRDAHFRKLEALQPGMAVELQTLGATRCFKVTDLEIHTPESLQQRVESFRDSDALLLSTCYPFRLIGPAPGRLLVICGTGEQVESSAL